MADEELEAGEGGKKSPILTYILIGVGVIVALAITILATMYFVGSVSYTHLTLPTKRIV